MAANDPKITFIFPARWLTEDKEFLGENLIRCIKKRVGDEALEILETVLAYRIVIGCIGKKPFEYKLEKKDIQKYLKPLLSNGRCISIDTDFTQTKSKTALPYMDFKIFF